MAFVDAFGVAMAMAAGLALIGALVVLRFMPAHEAAPGVEYNGDVVPTAAEAGPTSGGGLRTAVHLSLGSD